MSDLVHNITYLIDAESFAKQINESNDGIYCLLILDATGTKDLDVENIVMEALKQSRATALYCDVLVSDGQFTCPQLCPSYFMGLLNSGLIIQSPLFIQNNETLKLKYNSKLKIFHTHNYLRQIEQHHRIIHVPEVLYHMSVNGETIKQMHEDIQILNG